MTFSPREVSRLLHQRSLTKSAIYPNQGEVLKVLALVVFLFAGSSWAKPVSDKDIDDSYAAIFLFTADIESRFQIKNYEPVQNFINMIKNEKASKLFLEYSGCKINTNNVRKMLKHAKGELGKDAECLLTAHMKGPNPFKPDEVIKYIKYRKAIRKVQKLLFELGYAGRNYSRAAEVYNLIVLDQLRGGGWIIPENLKNKALVILEETGISNRILDRTNCHSSLYRPSDIPERVRVQSCINSWEGKLHIDYVQQYSNQIFQMGKHLGVRLHHSGFKIKK